MKKILDLFRTKNDNQRGWLGLKGKVISRDKQKHILVGFVLFLVLCFFIELEFAAAYTVAIAFFKEVLDEFSLLPNSKNSRFSFTDLIATCVLPVLVQLIDLYLL